MYYSNYVAMKLGIWKEQGKKELLKLLATIGIPLHEAKQSYMHMSVRILF